MASLIRRNAAEPTVAPSMMERPLEENEQAFEFAERLLAGELDAIVFLTGVGATALMSALETRYARDDVLAAIRRCLVIIRGPKPLAVMREWDVPVTARAAEPNTWRELLQVFDEQIPVNGKTIAVQEYGQPSVELADGLRDRGANVMSVTVYQWTMPDDTRPLEQAILRTINGEFDVLLFTSAQQIRHVIELADSLGKAAAWVTAANDCVIGSIGPTCSETANEAGLEVRLEPSHPTMGHLVKESIEFYNTAFK
ncbi:MAG: uroporphyrinogen-III synthase [Planctomycetota bacterium]|nr:uroporphyrinogen-III synthase [Planctomycetota bacterium]